MKNKILVSIVILLFCSLYCQENKLSEPFFVELPEGTEIFALEDGNVVGYGMAADIGQYLEIDYTNFGIIVKYCNLKSFKLFPNKKVSKGVKIGESGFTGCIEKPRLTLFITLKDNFYMHEKNE